MEPTFFGAPPLFGIYHPPEAAGRAADAGVLLCPPVGHEHTRSHRALKVLGEALARAGFHVLRFDYRGMGDSSGDASDGTVGAWCDDIEAALGELQELSGARVFAVVGLRLGATLAARTLGRSDSARRRPRVRHLVLWDPVLSGDGFLDLAKRFQVAFFNDRGRFPRGNRFEDRVEDEAGVANLLGYGYSADLRRSLHELDLRQIEPWPSAATSFVLSEASSGCDGLADRLRSAGRLAAHELVAGSAGAWDDYARHEDAFRAGLAVRAILAQLDGVRT